MKRTLVLLCVLLPVCVSQVAWGQMVYRLDVDGIIDSTEPGSVPDVGPLPLNVGDAFSMSLILNVSAPKLSEDPFGSVYGVDSMTISTSAFDVITHSAIAQALTPVEGESIGLYVLPYDTVLTSGSFVGAADGLLGINSGLFFEDLFVDSGNVVELNSLDGILQNLQSFPSYGANFSFRQGEEIDEVNIGSAFGAITSFSVVAVPEPSAVVLLSVFGCGLVVFRKRIRRKNRDS